MAAREVLYRRSFHSDGDLKGDESMIELDRGAGSRKASADGGFEAPRNSLDVPFSGFLETRRHSEVRCEEIPIGYELSRSLTTRRKGDEFFNLKPSTCSSDVGHLQAKYKSRLEPAQKPRAPSVVARLMGLDALPHHQSLQGSNQSSSRMSLPRECMASQNIAILSCQAPNAELASDNNGNTAEDEKLGYGELPFRNHPQEKQLQEFKREFAARQAVQGRHSLSSAFEAAYTAQEWKEEDTGQELNMDSAEFLDALDFLNANKEFFVRVLNEPKSLFSRHLQRSMPSMREGNKPKGAMLTRSFSESSRESCASLPLANSSAEASRQEISHGSSNEKVRAIHSFAWGPDEERPGFQRSRARGRLVQADTLTDPDEQMPTRIVVLKPNLGKIPSGKVSAPSSPLSRGGGNLKTEEGKENMKQGVKTKSQFRSAVGVTKQFLNDGAKDGLKDARDIARQIVKQVREDMSRRLSREGLCSTSDPSGSFVGRGPKAGVDVRTTSGVEGYGRASDNHRSYSSLPSSPRFLRHGRGDGNSYFGSSSKKGEELKSSSSGSLTITKSSREASKGDVLQGGSCDTAFSKQSSVRDAKSVAGRNMGRMSNAKARELKPEVPKVLPRSLSAPAAASTETRTCECKKAETSPFKERLLSLKDSFSLTKKKSSKKVGTSPCSSPLDSSELSTPRQADAVSMLSSSDGDESVPKFSKYGWPMAAVIEDGEDKEAAVTNCASAVLSDNSPVMQHSTGLRHWTALADSASETSLDKCEQPSPVSVLETPFQEESPSSVVMTATATKCHDLRHERPCIEHDYSVLSTRNLQGIFFSQPSSRHRSFDVSADKSFGVRNLLDELVLSFSLCDVTYPLVSEEELTYIRHILGVSGFSIGRPVMAHDLSSEHGLKPSIFEKLEAYYADKHVPISDSSRAPLDRLSRRLLFDVVDKIVSLKLTKYVSQPWARLTNQTVPLLCTGRQLLEHIVAELSFCRLVPSEGEDGAFEDAAARDLLKEDAWWPSECDIQAVVMELERLLCGDLIRELVNEYIRRRAQ